MSLRDASDPAQVDLASVWFTEISKMKRELAEQHKIETEELKDWYDKFSAFINTAKAITSPSKRVRGAGSSPGK